MANYTFPNEGTIQQHALIQHAIDGLFSDFDETLDDLGHSYTFNDFDFTQAHGGNVIVARPRNLPRMTHFAIDQNAGTGWYENPAWDQANACFDLSTVPAHPQAAGAAGTCPGCGAAPALAGAAFCPSCGSPLGRAGVPVPIGAGPAMIGGGGAQVPTGGIGGLPTMGPVSVPSSVRMTGRPEEKVAIPEGLGRGDSKKQEQEWLDKLLAAAETPDELADRLLK